MFGLMLYVADTISDIANSVFYYLNGKLIFNHNGLKQ